MSLNNIEKLIQIASIDQLYSILKKMKCTDFVNEDKNIELIDKSYENNQFKIDDIKETLHNNTINIMSKLEKLENQYNNLSVKLDTLISLFEINNNNVKDSEENIKLNIEEKTIIIKEEVISSEIKQVNHDNYVSIKKDIIKEDLVIDCGMKQESLQEMDEEDDEEYEEVETDEEDDIINNEKVQEKNDDNLDDEEEEVFEIEIDDITYFASDEENGILYEINKDGEIGKKVGIIKDGEPIFY
jgi:hypothetical protein